MRRLLCTGAAAVLALWLVPSALADQSGRKLAPADADALIAATELVMSRMGCPS